MVSSVRRISAWNVLIFALSSCSGGGGTDAGGASSQPPISAPNIPVSNVTFSDGEPCYEGVCRPNLYEGQPSSDLIVASEDFAAELMVVWIPRGVEVVEGAHFVSVGGRMIMPAIDESGSLFFVRTPPGSDSVAGFVNGDVRCRAHESSLGIDRFTC